MRLKEYTVLELGEILKSEFNLELSGKDLDKLAHVLVGYFSLMIEVENRHKFENRSGVPIDQDSQNELDREEAK